MNTPQKNLTNIAKTAAMLAVGAQRDELDDLATALGNLEVPDSPIGIHDQLVAQLVKLRKERRA